MTTLSNRVSDLISGIVEYAIAERRQVKADDELLDIVSGSGRLWTCARRMNWVGW